MKKCPFIVLFCLLCLLPPLKTNAQGSHDTVTVTPQRPTFLDSMHFDLYNASQCCCTQYYSKNVSVSDTTIILSFQYNDSMCLLCDCFAAGSHTQFACGPQKAGKYGIYKAEIPYCPPGQICLPLVIFKRLGEVIVDVPTSAVREKPSIEAGIMSPISILHSPSGMILQLRIEKAQAVSVHGYSANGACLAELQEQYLSQGAHSIDLNSLKKISGVMIIRVQGATFSASKIVNVSK